MNNIFNSKNKFRKYNIIINPPIDLKSEDESNTRKNKTYIKINFLIFLLLIMLYKISYSAPNKIRQIKSYFIPNTFRIAFVFGTRPEAIKLFPLIKQLKENKKFICILINTGQHKEMIQQILNSLNIDDYIDFNLNLMEKNQSLSELTSKTISKLEKIFHIINPNAVIVQGDTTTGFSAALSSFYQKIPIFHVEAGLRTHNLFYPYPEEFNRVTIDDISTLYFAPTEWAASNLLKENKNASNIFVTGNTIVDSLYLTLNNTNPSERIKNIIKKANSLCKPKDQCKIILLTCHRRENYFRPIYNIINAIIKLLKKFNDIVIIFPFHLNPNVQKSFKDVIPKKFYEEIIKEKQIKDKNYFYLNRFLIIYPLNYIDLLHLGKSSFFIMSDSGGIQEEAVIIGKPILILRENTERPEAVKLGCAFLTGTSFNSIFNYASSILSKKELSQKNSNCQFLYGKGNSRVIISKIIENYFKGDIQNLLSFNGHYYNKILSQYDNSIMNRMESNYEDDKNEFYDIVIVLTVWKRNNLERQLIQVKNQSALKKKKTNLIIFQNSNYINIDDIVNKWKESNFLSEKVDITFIKSPIDTGYFGRFIIPLTSSVRSDSYFFICDDDIIWGNRYFENMIRVVNEGSLATRNGRIIDEEFREVFGIEKEAFTKQICYNEDIEYDFGGHIWAGRISWLRKAWNHIPFSFENSEDFWLSATLKSFYNISTKSPKCPCPKNNPIIPDLCAASDKSAHNHENAKVGDSIVSHEVRNRLIKEIIERFKYQRLILTKPDYVKNINKKFITRDRLFILNDTIWNDSLYWQ